MSWEHRLAIVFAVLGVLCFFGMICAGMIYRSKYDVDDNLRNSHKEWGKENAPRQGRSEATYPERGCSGADSETKGA